MDGTEFATIYQVLDELGTLGTVAVGARGGLHAAIDRLRHGGAPAEHVALAERASVLVQDWLWGRSRAGGHTEAREKLAALRRSLLALPMPRALMRVPGAALAA